MPILLSKQITLLVCSANKNESHNEECGKELGDIEKNTECFVRRNLNVGSASLNCVRCRVGNQRYPNHGTPQNGGFTNSAASVRLEWN